MFPIDSGQREVPLQAIQDSISGTSDMLVCNAIAIPIDGLWLHLKMLELVISNFKCLKLRAASD